MIFVYKEVTTIPEFIDAIRLRVDVFIIEQGFRAGWEPDEGDKESTHFIALSEGKIVATARLRETSKDEYKIERMVVAKEYRKKSIGKGLTDYILQYTFRLKPKRLWLRSQVRTKEFFNKCGFKEVSGPFDMYGTPHIDMEYVGPE
ncbi:MAG: GNAT family N-acetyltransferase [Candidatus Micrarchaeota archaeon]